MTASRPVGIKLEAATVDELSRSPKLHLERPGCPCCHCGWALSHQSGWPGTTRGRAGYAAHQIRTPPVPGRDHPACGVAVSPVHVELPRPDESWASPRAMSRVCEKTTGRRTRTNRCDGESTSSNASNRLDPPSAFCRCIQRFTTPLTSNATLSPAIPFGPSGPKRCKRGRLRPLRSERARHPGLVTSLRFS